MGELIKTYGEISINNQKFEIELNDPLSTETGGIVHIQNEKLRMEMSQLDFYRMVGCINLAKENLLRMKGMKKDE